MGGMVICLASHIHVLHYLAEEVSKSFLLIRYHAVRGSSAYAPGTVGGPRPHRLGLLRGGHYLLPTVLRVIPSDDPPGLLHAIQNAHECGGLDSHAFGQVSLTQFALQCQPCENLPLAMGDPVWRKLLVKRPLDRLR